MRLGVVGGRLQGTEAAYLGAAAGYEVVLVDRCPDTPASGLADETHTLDVITERDRAQEVLGSCDVVIPACENEATLGSLVSMLPGLGVPCAFDMPSYEVTSSKIASDLLFAEIDVPRPVPWPECGFPVVVKPSGASGSTGVRLAMDRVELAAARRVLEAAGHDVVVQQFVDGPSLSIEVLRSAGGVTVPLLPTLLDFDATFDCKRVGAPVDISADLLGALSSASCRVAERLGLVGLMDVEVMVKGDVPHIIEVDARLPSQTPTVVYHSCGVNLVGALAELFTRGTMPEGPRGTPTGVCYQHVHASCGELAVVGEHALAVAGPLRMLEDTFGADRILTDRSRDADSWAATLICCGQDAQEARMRADEATRRLALDSRLTLAAETVPAIPRSAA